MSLRLALPALLLAAVLAAPAAGAAQDGDVAVFYRGECRLTVAGAPRECRNLIYMHFTGTGRSSFTTGSGDSVVGFSGDSDRQPRPEHFELDVNRLYQGPNPEPARGLCVVSLSTDGNVVRSLTCEAEGPAGPVRFTFTSDGNPPEVVRNPAG